MGRIVNKRYSVSKEELDNESNGAEESRAKF
jgi:hypothetical protein